MKCRVVRRSIGDYLDGTLSAVRHEAVREQLSCCPRCHALLDETRRVRNVLCNSVYDVAPPPGLADRIKLRAAQFQEEAQIHARPSSAAVGSPAFVATCASIFMGAVMFYVVITQFYAGGPDDSMGVDGAVIVADSAAVATTPTPVTTAPKAHVAPVMPAMVASVEPGPSRSANSTRAMAAPPADAGARRNRRPPEISRPQPAAVPAAPAPQPERLVAAPPAPKAPVKLASAAVSTGAKAPRPLVEGPVDRVAAAGTAAKSRGAIGEAPADETSRGVVAGLVAGYVVERYVVDRIIQAEPTLLAVTTSTPSSSGTALTERMKQ